MAYNYYGTTILSINQIRAKIRKAKNGNQKELDLLLRVNAKEADRANKRLKTQAAKTPNAFAYREAISYLNTEGRKSFSKSKVAFTKDLDALQAQLLALNRYNRAKSGTVKGARELENKNTEILRTLGVKVDQIDPDLLRQFLASDIFLEFKRFDSERALLEGTDALLKGRTKEDLQEAWEQYTKDSNATLDDAWEDFINGDSSSNR